MRVGKKVFRAAHAAASVRNMKTYRIGVIGLGQRIAHVVRAMEEVGWKLAVAGFVDPGPGGLPTLAERGLAPGRACAGAAALVPDAPWAPPDPTANTPALASSVTVSANSTVRSQPNSRPQRTIRFTLCLPRSPPSACKSYTQPFR